MSPATIRFLAEAPQFVDSLARWHHDEWGHLYADWDLAAARAELADHATRTGLPTTLVLERDGHLLGSVSLVREDAPELAGYGEPWLASLYVRPEARGCGHGIALAEALVAHAGVLGVPRLYLFTPGQSSFYARLGWQLDAQVTLNGIAVDLMSRQP